MPVGLPSLLFSTHRRWMMAGGAGGGHLCGRIALHDSRALFHCRIKVAMRTFSEESGILPA
jgi:hypothetical protein